MSEQSKKVEFRVYRGGPEGGEHRSYSLDVVEGMVVLDAMVEIQAKQASDLAIRCNCCAGKCGSCSAEINGLPRLMCKTRIHDLPAGKPIVVAPLKAFPVIKDLVTDVSWNYEVNETIASFISREGTDWRMQQYDVDRIQEFRKCIECFLCQDTCHVLREHTKKEHFYGPRFFVRLAGLAMHPLDREKREKFIKEKAGIGLCNITRCCTEVCPEKIKITDNAIIPLKERVADKFYDPLMKVFSGGKCKS